MRAGEPVPGVVEGAQPLGWGRETYDSLVDMEGTAFSGGGGGWRDGWRCWLVRVCGKDVRQRYFCPVF